MKNGITGCPPEPVIGPAKPDPLAGMTRLRLRLVSIIVVVGREVIVVEVAVLLLVLLIVLILVFVLLAIGLRHIGAAAAADVTKPCVLCETAAGIDLAAARAASAE